MHAHTQKLRVFGLAVLTLLVFVAAPGRVLGDDGTSSGSAGGKEKGDAAKSTAAKPAANKIEAPMPLTERERWLLDRVEQLEKRVAELEAKSGPKTLGPAESPAAQSVATQPAQAEVAAAPWQPH